VPVESDLKLRCHACLRDDVDCVFSPFNQKSIIKSQSQSIQDGSGTAASSNVLFSSAGTAARGLLPESVEDDDLELEAHSDADELWSDRGSDFLRGELAVHRLTRCRLVYSEAGVAY
jgi:hypothetical protein